ncbi:MAG: hypothetical protein ACXQS6_06965, partial [Candidatus Syntropharchaeales archaeon]
DRVIQEDTGEVRALSNLLHGGCQFGMYQDGAEGFEMSSSKEKTEYSSSEDTSLPPEILILSTGGYFSCKFLSLM